MAAADALNAPAAVPADPPDLLADDDGDGLDAGGSANDNVAFLQSVLRMTAEKTAMGRTRGTWSQKVDKHTA